LEDDPERTPGPEDFERVEDEGDFGLVPFGADPADAVDDAMDEFLFGE
jgi:hypothetical protein